MPQPQPNLFWPLRLIAVLSLVGPGLIFAFATWETRRDIDARADQRIERALDVLQEHALKSLQTVERAISEINEVLRGLSDATIRGQESDIFLRFKRTQQALSQIESIWAFDKHGHPLVSSIVLPVPRELNVSDRSYFKSQTDLRAGPYLSAIISARIGNVRVFVVSGRRPADDGRGFNGIVGITVKPQHFSDFYRKLASGRDAFALVRADGSILSRLPEVRFDAIGKAERLSREIQTNPDAGLFTAVSLIDGVERRTGYRRVPDFPVYVQAGIETGALNSEFWRTALAHFGLGLPAVLAMFSLALYALRRAQRFEEEAARRETAESALKQAQRLEAIGQLTGGVAHDFNNLLMVIEGNAQRLKRVIVSDAVPLRAFESIETAVKRGTALTRQLLSFSRRQTHQAQTIDLKERLPVIKEMLDSSLRSNISVEASIADDLWPTRIDLSELELALLNLAVNARDAMPEGGRLSILARNVTLTRSDNPALEGDFVSVTMTDTGVGIPPDVLNRVFEPFFTTKDVGKGTGLGLSQVYGFARQAGGTATVSSNPRQGTSVALYLPRSNEPLGVQQLEERPFRPKSRARGRVLLVEDNPEVAEVTREYLEEAGYIVHTTPDVASAQMALKEDHRKVDLVFTDVMMPGGSNGLDLAREIRREYGEKMPVVLATGYSDHAQTATDEGFVILRKPFDPSELRDAIAKAIRKARSR